MTKRGRIDRNAGTAGTVRVTAAVGAALLALTLVPAPAQAQRQEPRFAFEVYGGVATYGRFVEQFAAAGERELSGSTGLAVGASLGFFPSIWGINDIAARIGFMWTESDFEFENDDPDVPDDFDDDDADAGEFKTYTVSANVMKFLGDADDRVAPYGIAGVSGTWWSLDDGEDDGDGDGVGTFGLVRQTLDGDETVFRFGGMGGLGLQIRATDALAIRLEAARHEVRNPFDGDGEDAFGISTGQTFDEPSRVGVNRLSLGLTYTLYKDAGDRDRRRGRRR